MVVPYGNYLAFRDAHPDGEGTLYRIDDGVTPSDHIEAGTVFYLNLTTLGEYGKYFQWLDESGTTGIQNVPYSMFNVQSDTWYDLQGRKLSGKPTQKGIYIYQGKKRIIK